MSGSGVALLTAPPGIIGMAEELSLQLACLTCQHSHGENP
jgi:hypothetical protein